MINIVIIVINVDITIVINGVMIVINIVIIVIKIVMIVINIAFIVINGGGDCCSGVVEYIYSVLFIRLPIFTYQVFSN